MCIYPGEEFFIVSSGRCDQYHARRQSDNTPQLNKTVNVDNKKEMIENRTLWPGDQLANSTRKPPLRSQDTFSPLYDLDTAYDYHLCPHSCPDIYKPECVSANRGTGKYFKFFTFVNHCVGDMYYCKHYEEFAPPDDESEDVQSSPLGWSYCGASRYVQFAGFAEAASSMGHYGWLAGNHRYSHIMEPHQQIPGYGKK
ncbi:hypothetical protein K1T71_000637 [Dendrolimus kikuchii]|uniref:Uncharacterized protein n=1 Tax=Dendrolimus kikuchii TaxID=765133 RepID=A0ACC1DJR9_9NEOP|nr:hypothetical protein K1T71_000637 [Dendrolimus kikuchii]